MNRIFWTVLIVIGILGVLDTIFFISYFSRISAGVILPALIGVIFIVYGIMKHIKPYPWLTNMPTVRTIILIGIAVLIISIVVIEGLIIYHGQANASADDDSNYVIVLGCGIFSDGRLTLTLKNRLNQAYDYLMKYPNSVCVVSGGQGPFEPLPEGVAMHDYLVDKGIASDRILVEKESTSTQENIDFSIKIMDEYNSKLEKTAVIVTSDYHVFRSVFLARNRGIKAKGMPSQTPITVRINSYMREYLAVVKSLVVDYQWIK